MSFFKNLKSNKVQLRSYLLRHLYNDLTSFSENYTVRAYRLFWVEADDYMPNDVMSIDVNFKSVHLLKIRKSTDPNIDEEYRRQCNRIFKSLDKGKLRYFHYYVVLSNGEKRTNVDEDLKTYVKVKYDDFTDVDNYNCNQSN
ncbi:hypothetical protein CKF54_03675 [Psittacicella hinzii]|uniref:Uncharacterized protein n=1 Tax=Psittacicella hinzii TaxID=2028575 RepID=A0A3A1Y5Y9_9GAMM|nr:hypothetical protein [Psittacicella hinzii]RIY32911.1 hypothetical protein CKF54_03675 [Psittacicella hinzii]